jgi:hypothetical protein
MKLTLEMLMKADNATRARYMKFICLGLMKWEE